MKAENEHDSIMSMVIVVIFMMILCLGAIYGINTTPLVYVSNSTGECVKVIGGNCSDIDLINDRYEKVLVP